MRNLFRLRHCYGDERGLEIKYRGVFSSEQKALDAAEHLITAESFKDYPDSFIVTKEELGAINWNEVMAGIVKLNIYMEGR